IRAFFFARCDGHTRSALEVWGVNVPYCQSVSCPCGFSSLRGHGVGMCQEGARALAQNGRSYTDILLHYYSNVQVTALPPHSLKGGLVWPEQGDTSTLFHYEVQYEGNDPPIAAYVYIDGNAHHMSLVTPTLSSGGTYRYSTLLPAGEHEYAFHFEDGYNPAVDFPASGTLRGPTVRQSEGPTPTAKPSSFGTEAAQWLQTTQADFAGGTCQYTVVTREGDGEVTLAPDRALGFYTSTVKLAPIEFIAVGSYWQATQPAGTAITVALRSSSDGKTWSDWVRVPPMDAEREESRLSYGELLYLQGPYVQYGITMASKQSGVRPVLSSLTLVFIDSRRGNTAEQAQAIAAAVSPPTGPVIIPRAAWGADERLMTWPPEYRTVRKFVIHHTATSNADLDPAATVRAIYYYHAVTRGWGDIGYNYLIDSQGRIYEGRYGGEGVVGGHAKQYAWGSIGVSLIGNYDEVAMTAAMERSLVELIAWKGNLHFVHPTEHGFFIDRDLPNIFAHRDVAETTCPGRYAYARMQAIREAVLPRMNEIPPNVRIDAPLAESRVGGIVNCLTTVSPAVKQVSFYVDGTAHASDSSAPFSWKWNTSTVTDGSHLLRVEARTALNLSAEQMVTVTVDNTPPTGTLSGPTFTNVPTITLTTWS
ncbi:MAG: N-acetylmuramoyl-L-alanine amidase, partial [Chloroflexi bacterium]|nr:N-acetylmuramoyl-L-alanine amidase [Chloroflexota bacterium]